MAKILSFLFLVVILFSDQFYQRGERAFQDKIYKFAISAYQQEINKNGSEKEQSFYKIALCYFYLKQYQTSLKKFDQYIQFYPNGKQKINAQFYQANIFYLQKNYEGAMNLILFSLEKEKVSLQEKERYYFLIADIYTVQNEINLAIEELSKIKFYQNDLNARKGSLYYYDKKYSSALSFFDKIKEGKLFYNDREKIFYQKIKTLIELKKYSIAQKEINSYFKEYQKENSIYWEIFLLKNSINHYQEKYIESIQDMKKVIEKYSPLIEKNTFYKNLLLKAHLTLIEDYLAINQKILALSVLKNISKNKHFQDYKDKILWQQYEIDKKEERGLKSLLEIYNLYSKEKKYDQNYQIVIEKIITNPFYSGDNFKKLVLDYQKSKPTKKETITFFKKIAVYLFDKGDYQESANFFTKIYRLQPTLNSLIAIGETYLQNDQSIKAIDFFSDLSLKGEKKNYQNDILGYSYLLNNDYLTSIEYYRNNLSNNFSNKLNKNYKNKSLFYLGENYFLMNDYQKAIHYFTNFIKEDTEDNRYLHALYRVGFMYNHQKKYQKSIDFLEKSISNKMIDEFKNKSEVNYFLAKNYFELKKYSQTLKYSKKVTKDNFYYYDALFLMGTSYNLLKKEEEAKNSYFLIINDEEANQSLKNKSYYKLITIYLAKKNFLQAEFYVEKMLFFEQNQSEYFSDAIYKIVDFYYSNEKYSKIVNLAERLQEFKIKKDLTFYLCYMQGMSMLAQQDKEKAKNVFEKVITKIIEKNNKDNSKYYFEILYQLSLLYYEEEDFIKARKYLTLLKKSDEKELKQEAEKFLSVVHSKLYLYEIEKKPLAEIIALKNIPENLFADVQLVLAKKYFFVKQLQQSYNELQKIKKLDFGIKKNLVKYFFLKFKLLYELQKYQKLYQEGLEFYYQYELEEDRKVILVFYIAYASYKQNSKQDGDFFYKELLKIAPQSKWIKILKKLR